MQLVIIRLTRGFGSKLLLLALDLLGLILLFNAAHRARLGDWIDWQSSSFWVIALITVLTLYILDVYRTEQPATRARLPLQAFMAVPVAGAFSALYVYTLGISAFNPVYGRGVMPTAFILFAFWAAFWRWLVTFLQSHFAPHVRWIVICGGDSFQRLGKEIAAMKSRHDLVHFNADQADLNLDDIVTAFPETQAWGIIVLSHSRLDDNLARKVMAYRFQGITVLSLSEFFEQYWSRVPVLHLRTGWFVESAGFQWVHDEIGLRFQRILDIVISVIGLVIGAPILVLIALLIKLGSSGSALFIQTRVGLHGKPFKLVKFRTMVMEAEQDGPQWAEKDDPRVTRLGRFLRSSRIDELPQLWNILKGEMSLIGPRPERPEFIKELETKIPFYDLRHLVVPGVTGWAQVMYPYGASVEDSRKKLEYDLYYIKNHSIQLDFAILIKTLLIVFKRAGQ